MRQGVDCRRLMPLVGKKVCVKLPTKRYPHARPFAPKGGCTKLRKISASDATCAGVALAVRGLPAQSPLMMQLHDAAYSASTFAQLNSGLSATACAALEIGTWYCSCDGSSLVHQPPPTCKPTPCRWGKQPGAPVTLWMR